MAKRTKDQNGQEEATNKEALYAEARLKGKSKRQAAIAAGFSEESAQEMGKRLSRNVQVRRIVQERISEVKADTNEVLSLLALHLRADVADVAECIDERGQLDLKKARERGVSRLVKKIKCKAIARRDPASGVLEYDYLTEYEFHDSQSAARTLADILGIKQLPRENQHDAEAKRQWAEAMLARVMEETGLERAAALEQMKERAPTAAEWIH